MQSSEVCEDTSEKISKVNAESEDVAVTVRSSHKQSKKSKKHSKLTAETDSILHKPKKHKKPNDAEHEELPDCDLARGKFSETQEFSSQQPESELIKKKKKRPKDESKHKKLTDPSSAGSVEKKRSERKQKHTSRTKDVVREGECVINSSTCDQSSNLHPSRDQTECAAQEDVIVPVSPEEPSHSRSSSVDAGRSPKDSSVSRYSSRTSHSSYSRSPPRHHSRKHPESAVAYGRERNDRATRGRSSDRRKPDTFRRQMPHRTHGYRRISRSRETTPEDYSLDRFSSRYRRSRSRGSPKPHHSSYPYSHGHRVPTVRQRAGSPGRPFTQRHYIQKERSRSRSPSDKHERRHRPTVDKPVEQAQHSPRNYSFTDRSRGHDLERTSRTSRERMTMSKSESRSHKEGPSLTSKGGISCVDGTRNPPSKVPFKRSRRSHSQSPRVPVSERSGSRSAKASKSGTSREEKTDRHRGSHRASLSSERAESRHKAPDGTLPESSSSRSPRFHAPDHSHKPKLSSKVIAVLDLLAEVHTEDVSDVELESMLPPDLFSISFGTFHAKLNQTDATEKTTSKESEIPEADANNGTSAASTVDKERTDALNSLEKLSSQIRQKLIAPEPWDNEELSPSSSFEVEEDYDELVNNQSLVNIAASNKDSTYRPQHLVTTLATQWQQLVDSASKTLEPPASDSASNDFISPAVRLDNIFDIPSSVGKLIPIQKRVRGALALPHVGVSLRYLGEDLFKCLNNELACVTADEQGIGSTGLVCRPTEIAWTQRCPDAVDPSLASVLCSGDVLSAATDLFVRQTLLGAFG
ncbi:hypothetical protein PHET_09925 [Paragonimus heterotremus]|uniref:Uncharacterized protein n=1 Tax=Paragonimus heterotremus TaxID=100268 RepID=A0A8J4WCP2_9TREM|nr:hypothetical protein PHET_09925 [Paragonimus heterotremus]